MTDSIPRRLLAAGVTTGLSDFLFACVLSVGFYGSTVTRLWQGVASTILGRAAFGGGWRTAAIGVLMHFCVAFFWSAVFLVVWNRAAALRRLTSTFAGIAVAAAVYGPLIWMFMSLVLVPRLVDRPTTIGARWWIQLAGHIPFVALPMIAAIAGRLRRPVPAVDPRTA